MPVLSYIVRRDVKWYSPQIFFFTSNFVIYQEILEPLLILYTLNPLSCLMLIRILSLCYAFSVSFCVNFFPSELNPQSGPLLEPLSCWSALTLTLLFISGMQLSRSQVEESQRERQECKPVSQISTSLHSHTHTPPSLSPFHPFSLSLSLPLCCSHFEQAKKSFFFWLQQKSKVFFN